MDMIRLLFNKKMLVHFVLSLLFVFGLVYGVLQFLDSYTLHGQRIVVPDLTGLRITEMEKVLKAQKLKYVVVDSIYHPQKTKGVVLDQDPKPAYLVKENRTIYLTVNAFHPPSVAIPRLIDHSLRSALIILENLGLRAGNVVYMPDQCKDCVLRQKFNGKDIEEGDLVAKGATIDLVLGMGLSDETALVPLLINLTKDSAVKVLQDNYLNLGAEIYDVESVFTLEDSMRAKVYEQSPSHSLSSILPLGSSVDIWLTLDSTKIDTNLRSINVNDSLNQQINHDEFTTP
jgi:beta-lactam-binding protein with PASTA domain